MIIITNENKPTLTEAAADAVVPPNLLKLQYNAQEMGKIVEKWDQNGDHRLSVYEIFNGLINSPRFIYILMGLISSVYGIYKTIIGFANQDWDSGGILFSLSLILAAAVLYTVLKRNNEAQVKTLQQVNQYHEKRYEDLLEKYKNTKEDLAESRDHEFAWKTKATIYHYQAQSYHNRHPEEKFPDITTLED